MLERQRAAGDVGELLDLGADVAVDARHRVDELLGRQAPAGAVGDGSARRHQADLGQNGLGKPGAWIGRPVRPAISEAHADKRHTPPTRGSRHVRSSGAPTSGARMAPL